MGRPSPQKSNTELVNSLRANFQSAIEYFIDESDRPDTGSRQPDYKNWTSVGDQGRTLHIPSYQYGRTPLQEEREQYDITLKLFIAPGASVDQRESQAREALQLVLAELGVPSVDLLIASFPGVYFDEESEECAEKIRSRGPAESEPEPIAAQQKTWRILERLHDEKLVFRLGVSEFGVERLEPLLRQARVRPVVDQINLRDCCVLPKQLMTLAKENAVELLVHNDCSNILPKGTIRDLLGCQAGGARVLVDRPEASINDATVPGFSLSGDVQPQWVVKYTAVVKDRGVVENKGYFAGATIV